MMQRLPQPGTNICVALIGLVVLTCARANEVGGGFSYRTLAGLTALTVGVEGIPADFKAFGLEAQIVKTATETRLRDNGIAVLTADAARQAPGAALLNIRLNTNEDQTRLYFYGLSLELKQKVPLNDAGSFVSQTIWSSGTTGVLGPTELGRVNEYVNDLIALFVRDYRAQNRHAEKATEP